MELNGVNSYYTGYASTASQTNKDNKTSGTFQLSMKRPIQVQE